MGSKKMTQENKRAAALREVKKVVPLIERIKRERAGTDWSGEVTCPICQQKILVFHFHEESRTWGRCETKDCVAWMVSLVIGSLATSWCLLTSLLY